MGSIFNPIDDAVAWVIAHIYNVLGPIFGPASGLTWVLSIVFLVMLMRLIMVPLFIKQMHTQRAMTALTPKITELRKRYKGDKETLNSETMKLYQEAGVNPLMGCLPVVLQMPIFFALFSVLRQIADWKPGQTLRYHLTVPMVVNAHHAQIFGATIADKFFAAPLHAKVVIGATVLISMATTYLTMRQSMKRGMMPTGSDSPMGQSQKLMVYIMPLFALTGLIWPFGLVLYWVTTNVWTLGQQYVLLRKYPIGAAAMGPDGNKPIGGTTGNAKPAGGNTGGTTRGKVAGLGGGRQAGGGRPASSGSGSQAGSANGRRSSARPAKPGGVSDAKPGGVSDAKPGGVSGAKPGGVSDAKPGGVSDAKPGGVSDAKPGGVSDAKPGGAADAKPGGAADGKARPRGSGSGRSAAADGMAGGGSANGHGSSSDGGLLRKFGRSRSEPGPPAPAEPEIKLVRQQRQRQSRSKRSGKR